MYIDEKRGIIIIDYFGCLEKPSYKNNKSKTIDDVNNFFKRLIDKKNLNYENNG